MAQADKRNTTSLSRRTVLAGAASLPSVAAALRSLAMPVADDPIFAAIDEHRRLKALSDAAYAEMPSKKTGATSAEISEAEDYAGDLQSEHFDQLAVLMEMTPATAAGCIAMLRYLGAFMQECVCHLRLHDRRQAGGLWCLARRQGRVMAQTPPRYDDNTFIRQRVAQIQQKQLERSGAKPVAADTRSPAEIERARSIEAMIGKMMGR
jgi:hypothetical protein